MVSNDLLDWLESILRETDAVPWTSLVGGRDHDATSMILVGAPDKRLGEIYLTRHFQQTAPAADFDAVAACHTYLPALIREIRGLRGSETVADGEVTDELLGRLDMLVGSTEARVWSSSIEGRDHDSGDSFILVGTDEERYEDLYVDYGDRPASAAYLDAIAASHTYLPILIQEIRDLNRRLVCD